MGITRKIHNLFHPIVGHILMLHSVVFKRERATMLEITVEYLKKSLDSYLKMGFEPIGIDAVPDYLINRKKNRFVCFTIDDGYLDTLLFAYPVFHDFQIPFCLYVTTGFCTKTITPSWNPHAEMISIEQLRVLSKDPLCTIGCHTCTHPHLNQLSYENQYSELYDSKLFLEKVLDREINHLSYPHGDYNENTLRIASSLGFITATTTSGRPVRTDSLLLQLDRQTLIQDHD